jgi:hypothetical protein
VDESLKTSHNHISFQQCTDGQQAQTLECHFDKIYSDSHDFQRSAFANGISPLVKQAVEGQSTMGIFCASSWSLLGEGSHQSPVSGQYLFPKSTILALLSQAASQLLYIINDGRSVDSTGDEAPIMRSTVTFSWYNIDCVGPSETITDVLKSASATANLNATNGSNNPSLVLRELGKGRGMTVPGLWEIEISHGSGKCLCLFLRVDS